MDSQFRNPCGQFENVVILVGMESFGLGTLYTLVECHGMGFTQLLDLHGMGEAASKTTVFCFGAAKKKLCILERKFP